MKKIETVLDLLTFIDQKIKGGVINFDSPVKKISAGGKYLNNAKVGVAKQSKKVHGETVSRMGIACLVIES